MYIHLSLVDELAIPGTEMLSPNGLVKVYHTEKLML